MTPAEVQNRTGATTWRQESQLLVYSTSSAFGLKIVALTGKHRTFKIPVEINYY